MKEREGAPSRGMPTILTVMVLRLTRILQKGVPREYIVFDRLRGENTLSSIFGKSQVSLGGEKRPSNVFLKATWHCARSVRVPYTTSMGEC